MPHPLDWMDWRESARQIAEIYAATIRPAAPH
jgi:hypothetical protein